MAKHVVHAGAQVIVGLLLAGAATGCGGSSRLAGASVSPVPVTPPAGGGGQAQAVRLVGFDVDQVYPVNTGLTWLFVEDGGLIDPGTEAIFLDGVALDAQRVIMTMPLGNPGSGDGIFFEVYSRPVGTRIEVHAMDSAGRPVVSNAVVVKDAAFAAADMPPSFETLQPLSGTQASRFTTFTWTHPGSGASDFLLCYQAAGTTLPTVPIVIPVAVELTFQGDGNQMFQASQTVSAGIGMAFSNEALASGSNYFWNVVALDSDGWGIGTTVNVNDYWGDRTSWPRFQAQ